MHELLNSIASNRLFWVCLSKNAFLFLRPGGGAARMSNARLYKIYRAKISSRWTFEDSFFLEDSVLRTAGMAHDRCRNLSTSQRHT
jgi:hypothetical protein